MSPSSHFHRKSGKRCQTFLVLCNTVNTGVFLFMMGKVWMWFSKIYFLWQNRAGRLVSILVETKDKNMKIRKTMPLGRPKSRDFIISSFCSDKSCQNANFWVKCAVEERRPKGNDLKATTSTHRCQFVFHIANVPWWGKTKAEREGNSCSTSRASQCSTWQTNQWACSCFLTKPGLSACQRTGIKATQTHKCVVMGRAFSLETKCLFFFFLLQLVITL